MELRRLGCWLKAYSLDRSTVMLNAAYAVGRSAQVGSLEPGKQANVLILETPDYRNLAYRVGENLVETVIKRGQVVYSSGGPTSCSI